MHARDGTVCWNRGGVGQGRYPFTSLAAQSLPPESTFTEAKGGTLWFFLHFCQQRKERKEIPGGLGAETSESVAPWCKFAGEGASACHDAQALQVTEDQVLIPQRLTFRKTELLTGNRSRPSVRRMCLEGEDPECCRSQGGLRNWAEFWSKGKKRKIGATKPAHRGTEKAAWLVAGTTWEKAGELSRAERRGEIMEPCLALLGEV